MASAFDLGTPEALAPGAKTATGAGITGSTQDKLAAFRSHASDDVVKKIREATKLLEQRQAAQAAAPEPPAEEQEGWGVPDWYDEEDSTADTLEVDVMLSAAKRLLSLIHI